ncbi:MAG TPA: ABC transporter substrate-binding protein [Kofleriaceae bacterium]|nr:ABC transporter substrate-binding protein [Kofleriaceae bacterium]
MKLSQRATHIIFMCLALLAAPAAADAQAKEGEGTQTVRRANDAVQELLRQKAEPGSPAEKKLASQVTRSVRDFLDIETLGQRAMRDHWGKLSAGQRRDFVQLLRELVESNYIRALRANVNYEVKYLGERTEGEQLLVKTEILAKRRGRPRSIGIDYVLTRDGGAWRAFDVVTDGVGLVENYRAQFNKIIARDGFGGLMERMRKKRAKM